MIKKISEPVNRPDAAAKTGGYACYIDDMYFEGALFAATLRSERPRAVIEDIEMPDLPDGYYIVDKDDVPGMNRVKMLVDDQPFFAEDTVNYIGEPILLVAGPDRAKIETILSMIRVRYADLEPVLSIEETASAGKDPIYSTDNCFAYYEIKKGDIEKAFDNAKEILMYEYRTGLQEQLYLEPQGVVGVYENGQVTVYGSMQCPYYIKAALVQGLGWDEGRIRVVQAATGGAFGGKEEYPSIIAGHAAFAAVKTGKPVRLIFNRREDISSTTKRHPSIIKIRTALDGSNRIIALEADIRLDGGAYAGLSPVVLQRAMFAASGAYSIPNVMVSGRVLATNNVPSGAMRGFGAPQSFFAVEMHMQNIARKLGMDPLDIKMDHILKRGDSTVTGGELRHDVKLPEMISFAEEMSGYRGKQKAFRGNTGDVLRGIGLSVFYHGCAFTGSGEKDKIKANARLKKNEDGKVQILVSNVEMGQGALTTLKKIVSRVLEIPFGDVIYENPDTSKVPDSGPTVASRTVMIVGFLLEKAARDLKDRWDEASELEITRVYEEPEYIKWDPEKFEGDAYPVYSWGVNVIEVEVDPATFVTRVTGIWGVYDIGAAIDEKVIKGQIEGGITQGLGYAALEVMNTEKGKILQGSLTDYIIPNSVEFPEMGIRLVDNPYEYGPFGAKGAGELPFVGAAPAFASAVQNAIGIRVSRLPVTPEYILEISESEN
ncbi:MAG TPA: aldehyde oxidase [Spirochaetes bacterium]|nr:aldehyde oxidase [Spirochaetota bacterium]